MPTTRRSVVPPTTGGTSAHRPSVPGLTARAQGNKYTPESWEARYDEFRTWATNRCRGGGRFYRDDLVRAGGVGHSTASRLVERGIADGWLVQYGEKQGYGVMGAVPQSVTLQNLVELAERSVRSDQQKTATPVGRRDVTETRRITALTPSQFDSVRASAGLIAWGVTGDKRRLSDVGAEHFAWDDAAKEFALMPRVAGWSDAKARATTEAARDANRHARQKHMAGARLLFDLAATSGMIKHADVHEPGYVRYAVELQPWVDDMLEKIAPEATTEKKLRTNRRDGLIALARAISYRGQLTITKVDWAGILEDLQRLRDAENSWLTGHAYANARSAYGALYKQRLVPEGAPAWNAAAHWSGNSQTRLALVSTAACEAAAVRKDFGGWDATARGLAHGRYGLEGYATWVDRDSTASALTDAGLPPKSRPNPTLSDTIFATRRTRRGRPQWARKTSVIERDLYQAAQVAGWAVQQEVGTGRKRRPRFKFDPMRDDALLDLILDKDLHAAYFKARLDEHGAERLTMLSQTAYVLSVLASPWCEARATEAGDHETAKRLREISDGLRIRSEDLFPNDDERTAPLERVRVWEADGREGYSKLDTLIDVLLQRAERWGGMPAEEHADAIRAGHFVPRNRAFWASAVRMACVFALARRVPLRSDNVRIIQIGPFTRGTGRKLTTRKPHWVASDPDAPWGGSIALNFTSEEMKAERPFEPYLIHPRDVGGTEAEADLRRWLWELYLMPGGAREELLRLEDGSIAPSPYLFPVLVRQGKKKSAALRKKAGYRWDDRGFGQDVRNFILSQARRVGIDPAAMRATFGTASPHIWRHLFGTHWVRRGQVKFASLMLHHKSSEFTEKRYSGASESDVSVDAMWRNSTLRIDDVRVQHATMITATEQASSGGPNRVSAPTVSETTSGDAHVCWACYEPLRVRNGIPARRCHACTQSQEQRSAA